MFKALSLFVIAQLALGGLYLYTSQVDHCQGVVLKDLAQHQQFTATLAQFSGQEDFLTTLSRGK